MKPNHEIVLKSARGINVYTKRVAHGAAKQYTNNALLNYLIRPGDTTTVNKWILYIRNAQTNVVVEQYTVNKHLIENLFNELEAVFGLTDEIV